MAIKQKGKAMASKDVKVQVHGHTATGLKVSIIGTAPTRAAAVSEAASKLKTAVITVDAIKISDIPSADELTALAPHAATPYDDARFEIRRLTAGGYIFAHVDVPAVSNAYEVPNTGELDLTNADVQDIGTTHVDAAGATGYAVYAAKYVRG